MARREKGVDLIARRGERNGVRSLFGRDASELLHCLRVEYVDAARLAYGDIQASVHAIEEHDIGCATQGVLAQDLAGLRIERDQLARVAGAEETLRVEIEIQSVSAGRRNGQCARNPIGLSCVDHDDLGGLGNVHIEYLRLKIIDRPTCPPRRWDLGSRFPLVECDDGEGVGTRYGRVPDIGDEDLSADMIKGEAVGTDTDSHLCHLRVGARSKKPIVFSDRFEVMISCAASLTMTPATPFSCGTE